MLARIQDGEITQKNHHHFVHRPLYVCNALLFREDVYISWEGVQGFSYNRLSYDGLGYNGLSYNQKLDSLTFIYHDFCDRLVRSAFSTKVPVPLSSLVIRNLSHWHGLVVRKRILSLSHCLLLGIMSHCHYLVIRMLPHCYHTGSIQVAAIRWLLR